MNRVMVLTVRQKYAGMILEGRKQADLRRRRPRAPWPMAVLIYQAGTGVVGTAEWCGLGTVRSDNFILWDVGLTPEEAGRYLDGRERGYLLFLYNARRFQRPVPLGEIRDALGDAGWFPPQSWRYLTTDQAGAIAEAV